MRLPVWIAPLLLPLALAMASVRLLLPRVVPADRAFDPLWISVPPAALTIYAVVMVFVLEWQAKGGLVGERLRARGQDPEQAVAVGGATMLLSPLSAAVVFSWVGLSAAEFAVYAAVSVGGIAFWNWRYRHVIRQAWSARKSRPR